MKDETKCVPVLQSVRLKWKMYCFAKQDGLGDRKAKEINNSVQQ